MAPDPMTDEASDADMSLRACTFKEHFASMKGLAEDVRDVRAMCAATTGTLHNLNLVLSRIDVDIVKTLHDLNNNLTNGVDVARSLIKVSRMIVTGFVIAIAALVTQAMQIEINFPGLKIQSRSDSGDGREQRHGERARESESRSIPAPQPSVAAANPR
jgi:hypothetical protein